MLRLMYSVPLYVCRPMFAYAPLSEQPVLGRKLQELPDDEKPIYEMFTNPEYVETLIKYISLEENKGKDRFNAKYFVLFKVDIVLSSAGFLTFMAAW
jgi:hypothetical protein